MKYIVEFKNVEKSYHEKKVLHDINFEMKEGDFLALLGPNGAGKSTIISILCTRILKDSGSVYVDGLNMDKDTTAIRKAIGVVFQDSCMDGILHGYDNLYLRCGLYGFNRKQASKRVKQLSELCGLETFLYQRVSTLSGGQRRRLDIARALIASPALLIMDEPTTGLDPMSRQQIWQTIMMLRKEYGMSILLTTHYMEEAQSANTICMIDHGIIKAYGSLDEITHSLLQDSLYLYAQQLEPMIRIINKHNMMYIREKNRLKVIVHKPSQALTILQSCALSYNRFEFISGTLEEAYMSIIEGNGV